MTIKEYRQAKGITQAQLAKELSDICPGIDAPLVSKIEKGLCLPSATIQSYIDLQDYEAERKKAMLTPELYELYKELLAGSRTLPRQRVELSLLMKMDDRTLRKSIAQLRQSGIRVCSDSGARGYWVAKDDEDYRRFRREYIKRAKVQLKTVSQMDSYMEGQIEWQS